MKNLISEKNIGKALALNVLSILLLISLYSDAIFNENAELISII